MIYAQTRLPGISVSQVARRYDVNANLVFTWLKDPRFALSAHDENADLFLPIEVVQPVNEEPEPARRHGEMIVELGCGSRLKVTGAYDPDALATLIRKLRS